MDDKKETVTVEKMQSPQKSILDLKAIREARGLTLHEIFETTRVSRINLAAVENGDYHRLPPPIYARNFIRKYACAVGTDEKPILDCYEKHLESLMPRQEETPVRKPWPEADRRYRFLFISLAAVIVAGILVSALFLYDHAAKPSSSSGSPPPMQIMPTPGQKDVPTGTTVAESTQASADTPVPVPATTPIPVPAPTEVNIPFPSAAGKMYHLVIEARDLTWIRITEDRNPAYQVLLKPGDKIERMASDHFQLDIGNAGGINLTFQGKSVGNLGKLGQIIHMRLPEKGSERKAP